MDSAYTDIIKQRIAEAYQRKAPPVDFPPLDDIPVSRYISDDFWQAEQQHLWPKSWLFAAHSDELPEVGSSKLWLDAGAPIVIVRDEQQQFRAFYNTCQHRAGPLVVDDYSQQARLRCGFHGWTYNLQGELIAVPDKRDFVALDMSCRNLQELRCESWGNWIFVNRNSDAESLTSFMAPIADELQQFDLQSLRYFGKHSICVDANWKTCLDSFMETYHLRHIHPKTVDVLLDHKGTVISLLEQGHNKMYTPNRAGLMPVPKNFTDITSVGELPRISNLAYSLFPNIVMPLDAAGFPLLIFWPVDKSHSRLDVLWFAPNDEMLEGVEQPWKDWPQKLPKHWLERIALFDQVLDEDVQFLADQQRSMETGAIKGMPLSFLEQRIYHRHEAFDSVLGAKNIPVTMAVTPLLQSFIEKSPLTKDAGNG
ncbi:MAG: phenylpropionate dioxygenase-like ring-hydroxylating dioxygenase large terminal subunit [Oceanicoccus sp.]|jgi:phenylpropionate dioxygenase-like ring-hydroxylating dioxygenase large terminal subunit